MSQKSQKSWDKAMFTCGIPSSFYNSLQTSGDWGDKLLKFRNRNVVLFLSNTGF